MNRIAIFTAGRFGTAVADRLARYTSPIVEPLETATNAEHLDAIVGSVDFVVAALWRRHESACERLDDACARLGVPWTPVLLEGRYLSMGPVVVPAPCVGRSACYACFRRRVMTHHETPDRELALLRAYEQDPALGPHGFIDASVAMASAFLAIAQRKPTELAGTFRRVRLLECEVEETRIVRIHGCGRCGAIDPAHRRERFVTHLVPAVAEILR